METTDVNITNTFIELDKKLSILNQETLNYIKLNIMTLVSDAYRRGQKTCMSLNEPLFKQAIEEAVFWEKIYLNQINLKRRIQRLHSLK